MFETLSTKMSLFIAGLVVLLGLEFVAGGHGFFSAVDFWGFNAWFGFGITVLFIVVARILTAFIRRENEYYD